jgi:hypothetical protein
MNLTSCLLGSWFVKNPFFLLAVTLLFVEKSAKVLLYFGLDCGLLVFSQIFYSQAVIPRTVVESPAFLEYGSEEKIAVCAHTTCDPNK